MIITYLRLGIKTATHYRRDVTSARRQNQNGAQNHCSCDGKHQQFSHCSLAYHGLLITRKPAAYLMPNLLLLLSLVDFMKA
ncbi:MAG: hypothetical protein M0C28_36290 [Candidatus Moduliflexus flocculans]|nr:hypothetical protein [Candidatus Moduliflexus flocculans]